MLNPIVSRKQYIVFYVVIWLLVILSQMAILNFYYDIPLIISISDALIYNGIFALLGFNLWYVIRYALGEKTGILDQGINHVLIAVSTVALWMAASYFTLKLIYKDETTYHEFLNDSLPWRAVTGLMYYAVFILIYYLIIYYENLQEKLQQQVVLNNLVKEAELQALKSQINPHFLFNSLNSMSSLTLSDPPRAQEMIIQLSEFMRYSLSHDRNELTSLKNELENIHRYLNIEKIRFGKRLKYVEKVPEECLLAMIPNMILQPLLENAIKHGVYNSTDEVLIELSCTSLKNEIEISLINDFDPDFTSNTKGEGIGLQNIQKRLEIVYQRTNLLKTISRKMEFEARLNIPQNL